MAMVIEAPAEHDGGAGPSVFLAGGITAAPPWQDRMVALLGDHPGVTLLNPRRRAFDLAAAGAARDQIAWEFRHLRRATVILFWFPCETLCPIALYELGAWSMTAKPLVVGMHPDYQRRRDVEIQTALARPEVPIAHTLEDVALQVRKILTSLQP